MTTPDLTEIVNQWAAAAGAPPATIEMLFAERDVLALRRAAEVLDQDSASPYLSNAERVGLARAAVRVRELADAHLAVACASRTRVAQALAGTRVGRLVTPGERRVIVEMSRGGSCADVADRLNIAVDTLKTLLSRAKARTHATSTPHLVALAIAYGAVPADVALGEGGEVR